MGDNSEIFPLDIYTYRICKRFALTLRKAAMTPRLRLRGRRAWGTLAKAKE
jgi:hypothetical protein